MANTQPVPAAAISTPETAGPKTFIVFCVRLSRAFAGWKFAGETVCGTSASDAGPKKAEAAPNTAAVTKNRGSVMWCGQEHHCGERLDDGAHAVAREHHRAARQAVGDDPADQGERHARDHERGQHAAERRRRAVDREDGEGERDGDERVPDRGGDAAEPEQAEARLPKWGERLRRTHGLAP